MNNKCWTRILVACLLMCFSMVCAAEQVRAAQPSQQEQPAQPTQTYATSSSAQLAQDMQQAGKQLKQAGSSLGRLVLDASIVTVGAIHKQTDKGLTSLQNWLKSAQK
jgi:hypothetical protein